jgi:diadenosine tetraphosphate (Ap4A) HIT family hydrolase
MANRGENPTAIAKLKSGWVVLGDDQRLRGYCLLLSDPVVDNLHSLEEEQRKLFLWEMSQVGDALTTILNPSIINYSIYGNHDRALHAHIHPRYDTEESEMRGTVPFIYLMNKYPPVPFDAERDEPLKREIREFLKARTCVVQ